MISVIPIPKALSEARCLVVEHCIITLCLEVTKGRETKSLRNEDRLMARKNCPHAAHKFQIWRRCNWHSISNLYKKAPVSRRCLSNWFRTMHRDDAAKKSVCALLPRTRQVPIKHALTRTPCCPRTRAPRSATRSIDGLQRSWEESIPMTCQGVLLLHSYDFQLDDAVQITVGVVGSDGKRTQRLASKRGQNEFGITITTRRDI